MRYKADGYNCEECNVRLETIAHWLICLGYTEERLNKNLHNLDKKWQISDSGPPTLCRRGWLPAAWQPRYTGDSPDKGEWSRNIAENLAAVKSRYCSLLPISVVYVSGAIYRVKVPHSSLCHLNAPVSRIMMSSVCSIICTHHDILHILYQALLYIHFLQRFPSYRRASKRFRVWHCHM